MSDRDGMGQDRPVGPTGPDRASPAGRSWPLVTVVLPVRDEEAGLAATLGALLEGDYPGDRLEVLVVDGRSADGTAALARGFADRDRRVRVLDNPGRTAARGLNVGLAAAVGAVIVRLDGHSIPAPDYVRACVAALERTGAWVVGGRMAGFGRTWFGRAVAAVHGTRLGSGGAAWRTGDDGPADTVYLGAWPRWALDRVGGWDPGLERNQDSELCLRIRAAGGLVWLDRSIRTRTVARDRPDALWRQYFGYGAGRAATLARHPGSLGARQAVPAAATAVAVVLVALAPWSGRAARWLGGLVAAWCAAVLVSVASAAPREPRSVRARMPAAYAIMHLAWGAGFWVGLVRQADRRRGTSSPAGREAPRG